MNKTTNTTTNNATKTNENKNNLIFSFRGNGSIGTEIVAKSGLKQLTNRSNDATQLILSGKSSLNLRKKQCFINATEMDTKLFESTENVQYIDEIVVNGNSVDAIRPNKIYFKLENLKFICDILAKNKFNVNGFEIV